MITFPLFIQLQACFVSALLHLAKVDKVCIRMIANITVTGVGVGIAVGVMTSSIVVIVMIIILKCRRVRGISSLYNS